MEKEEKDFKHKSGATNYGDTRYWDHRYAKKKDERFQWLQPYCHLKIEACLPKGKQSAILNIGCGNSIIQESLYEDGYHQITSNDISSVVIQQMQQSQKQKGMEEMAYDVMDVRQMTYADQSFDMIIDKSTIDTLMCSDNPLMNVARMIEQSYRVLRNGGFYFTVSYSAARKQQFERKHVDFEVVHKELTRVDQKGHEMKNHLYVCKKIPMKKCSEQERKQFYAELKEIEEKQYPPV